MFDRARPRRAWYGSRRQSVKERKKQWAWTSRRIFVKIQESAVAMPGQQVKCISQRFHLRTAKIYIEQRFSCACIAELSERTSCRPSEAVRPGPQRRSRSPKAASRAPESRVRRMGSGLGSYPNGTTCSSQTSWALREKVSMRKP